MWVVRVRVFALSAAGSLTIQSGAGFGQRTIARVILRFSLVRVPEPLSPHAFAPSFRIDAGAFDGRMILGLSVSAVMPFGPQPGNT
jgi:hypothetical protein